MKCHSCAHDNAPQMKFCGECGARLVAMGPACRSANAPTNKFCAECGASLGPVAEPATAAPAVSAERYASPQAYTPKHLADKVLSSRSVIEGERKEVTVLFADVRLHRDVRTARPRGRSRHHAPSLRDHPRSGPSLRRNDQPVPRRWRDGAVRRANRARGPRASRAGCGPRDPEGFATARRRLPFRIGINTGLAVVGAIGGDLRMDYTAVGDTTNLPARMLNLVQPGQIVRASGRRQLDRSSSSDGQPR